MPEVFDVNGFFTDWHFKNKQLTGIIKVGLSGPNSRDQEVKTWLHRAEETPKAT